MFPSLVIRALFFTTAPYWYCMEPTTWVLTCNFFPPGHKTDKLLSPDNKREMFKETSTAPEHRWYLSTSLPLWLTTLQDLSPNPKPYRSLSIGTSGLWISLQGQAGRDEIHPVPGVVTQGTIPNGFPVNWRLFPSQISPYPVLLPTPLSFHMQSFL